MNRIITILVTIFILLLLYIWISHVWGSDKPRHPRQIVDAKETEMSDEMTGDSSLTAYNSIPPDTSMQEPLTDDEFATERKTEPAEEVKPEPAKVEPVVEKKVTETKKEEPKPAPVAKKPTPAPAITSKPVSTPAKTETKPAVSSTASAADGQHLVIAGNFSKLENAQQRLDELKKAGYKEAEIVNFDLSEYHTVCAGRFSDVNEARKLVKKLKDYNKIDAYVRIGG